MGSSKSSSALWSDQPFCRHWAVSFRLHWKYWHVYVCLQNVGRHVCVNLMGRTCSGVTVDPIVHKIHNVYVLLVKI